MAVRPEKERSSERSCREFKKEPDNIRFAKELRVITFSLCEKPSLSFYHPERHALERPEIGQNSIAYVHGDSNSKVSASSLKQSNESQIPEWRAARSTRVRTAGFEQKFVTVCFFSPELIHRLSNFEMPPPFHLVSNSACFRKCSV